MTFLPVHHRLCWVCGAGQVGPPGARRGGEGAGWDGRGSDDALGRVDAAVVTLGRVDAAVVMLSAVLRPPPLRRCRSHVVLELLAEPPQHFGNGSSPECPRVELSHRPFRKQLCPEQSCAEHGLTSLSEVLLASL